MSVFRIFSRRETLASRARSENKEETIRRESLLRLVNRTKRTYADAFAEQFDGGRGKLRTKLPPVA